MVSRGWSFLPAEGSHSHAYRPVGLLLLLGDDDDDADILKLQEGVLHPEEAANSNPQPCMVGHEGIQGEGVLPPSHGEDAEIDLLQPQIEGRNSDDGLLPPFRGEYAENNLLTPKIKGRKEKKGSIPVSKTVSDSEDSAYSGDAASADDEDEDGSIADADAETGYGPADDGLGTHPVAADANGPNPAPETGVGQGLRPCSKTTSDPGNAADEYDADFDKNAADEYDADFDKDAADEYDAESANYDEDTESDADESDAEEHAAEDANSAEDDFAADAVDAEEDESDASDQDDEEETASTDPDEDGAANQIAISGVFYLFSYNDYHVADMHAVNDGALLKISLMMGMHTALQEPVIYCHDYDDATTHQAKPRIDPKVKKKTSLLLCITINMPFHPGEQNVPHAIAAKPTTGDQGEEHLHATHDSHNDDPPDDYVSTDPVYHLSPLRGGSSPASMVKEVACCCYNGDFMDDFPFLSLEGENMVQSRSRKENSSVRGDEASCSRTEDKDKAVHAALDPSNT